jgi:hypothetical protein
VFAWTDILVPGWNGAGGPSHAAEVLPVEKRDALTLLSWNPRGNSIDVLTKLGYRVFHGETGYVDSWREDLPKVLDKVAGEAFATFYATPWDAWGGYTGSTALQFHWPSVILAGATAWRPALAETPIDVLLDATRDLPVYRPGWRGDPSNVEPLAPTGSQGAGAPRESWLVAGADHPIDLQVTGRARGLSLLQGAALAHDREMVLAVGHRGSVEPPVVATVVVTYQDGATSEHDLRYGRETYRTDIPRALLWGTTGSVRTEDRVLYRWEAELDPTKPIAKASLVVEDAGAVLYLAGADVFRP